MMSVSLWGTRGMRRNEIKLTKIEQSKINEFGKNDDDKNNKKRCYGRNVRDDY